MMLLINKSILKELIIAFLIALVFLNFTIMTEKLLRLSKLFATVGINIFDILKIILFIQPELLIITLPMSLLLSTLVVYGRMNADNEITILKTSGISFFNISRPVMYLGLGCLVISFVMSFYLGPKGSVALKRMITEILTIRAPLVIEEGIFNTAFKDILILVKEKPDPTSLKEIFIVDDRDATEQKILIANEGKVSIVGDSIGFSLKQGRIYIIKADTTTEIQFGHYFFKLTPHVEYHKVSPTEMTPAQLLQEAEKNPDKRNIYLIEYHRRFSLPLMCLIIMLLAPSLALKAGKVGRLGGLSIGLLVFGVYYTLMIYTENLAVSKKIPTIVGSWTAFTVFTIFSILIVVRVNKK
ncbi:MAG: LptF/LptG family permease [Thermodesulfovibrionales bacterium]|nr:LptF/LptG family permease [Thermodesulfovibrionales bacterium]